MDLDEPSTRCRALWAAILAQALNDARENAATSAEGRMARAWLTGIGVGYVLAFLEIDQSWWRARVVPELHALWAEMDAAARRPGRGQNLSDAGRARRRENMLRFHALRREAQEGARAP